MVYPALGKYRQEFNVIFSYIASWRPGQGTCLRKVKNNKSQHPDLSSLGLKPSVSFNRDRDYPGLEYRVVSKDTRNDEYAIAVFVAAPMSSLQSRVGDIPIFVFVLLSIDSVWGDGKKTDQPLPAQLNLETVYNVAGSSIDSRAHSFT